VLLDPRHNPRVAETMRQRSLRIRPNEKGQLDLTEGQAATLYQIAAAIKTIEDTSITTAAKLVNRAENPDIKRTTKDKEITNKGGFSRLLNPSSRRRRLTLISDCAGRRSCTVGPSTSSEKTMVWPRLIRLGPTSSLEPSVVQTGSALPDGDVVTWT
jgi:hypothetical protein